MVKMTLNLMDIRVYLLFRAAEYIFKGDTVKQKEKSMRNKKKGDK
jgi:hypothetical protein